MFHTTLMRITLWFYDVDIKLKTIIDNISKLLI